MSTDDAGKRELSPVEAFAAITFDRVLIIHETSGRMYIRKTSDDEYHWLSFNNHGAYCGDWFHDRIKTKTFVKKGLRSEHCHNQAHEQISNLKTRVKQVLNQTKKPQ